MLRTVLRFMRKTCEGAGKSWLVSTFVFCIPHQTMLGRWKLGRLDGRDMWHTLERKETLKKILVGNTWGKGPREHLHVVWRIILERIRLCQVSGCWLPAFHCVVPGARVGSCRQSDTGTVLSPVQPLYPVSVSLSSVHIQSFPKQKNKRAKCGDLPTKVMPFRKSGNIKKEKHFVSYTNVTARILGRCYQVGMFCFPVSWLGVGTKLDVPATGQLDAGFLWLSVSKSKLWGDCQVPDYSCLCNHSHWKLIRIHPLDLKTSKPYLQLCSLALTFWRRNVIYFI